MASQSSKFFRVCMPSDPTSSDAPSARRHPPTLSNLKFPSPFKNPGSGPANHCCCLFLPFRTWRVAQPFPDGTPVIEKKKGKSTWHIVTTFSRGAKPLRFVMLLNKRSPLPVKNVTRHAHAWPLISKLPTHGSAYLRSLELSPSCTACTLP